MTFIASSSFSKLPCPDLPLHPAKGFKRHGSSWAEAAKVVRTRDEEQVSRYALRWVDDKGHVRSKTNVKNTGRWTDDEHERFIEVCRGQEKTSSPLSGPLGRQRLFPACPLQDAPMPVHLRRRT